MIEIESGRCANIANALLQGIWLVLSQDDLLSVYAGDSAFLVLALSEPLSSLQFFLFGSE